jgi:hypothetical protein
MPLRHWTDSEVPEAMLRGHNLHAHEVLSLAHIAWFWLVGPGSSSLLGPVFYEGSRRWDVNVERKKSHLDCRSRGWTADTLREVHVFVERLRARAKRPPAAQNRATPRLRGRKDLDLDGSAKVEPEQSWSELGLGRILPTVERDWPETFLLSDQERAEKWRSVQRAWSPRGAPAAQRNDLDRDPETGKRERMPQPKAQVLFDGDDQGNARHAARDDGQPRGGELWD